MPRYFFHIKRGQMTILDQNGIELGGQQEAGKRRGERRLQEILTESDPTGRGERGAVIIADEEWCTVLELPF